MTISDPREERTMEKRSSHLHDDDHQYIYKYDCSQSSAINLQVVGRKCKLYRNDNIVQQIEQGKHLIILHGNGSVHGNNDNDDVKNVHEFHQERLVLGKVSLTSSSSSSSGAVHAESNITGHKCDTINNDSDSDDNPINAWIEIVHPPAVRQNDYPSSYNERKEHNTVMTNKPTYVDRYDVRALLSDEEQYFIIHHGHAPFKISSCKKGIRDDYDYSWDDDLSEEQGRILNAERFGDLMKQQQGHIGQMNVVGKPPLESVLHGQTLCSEDGDPHQEIQLEQQQQLHPDMHQVYRPSQEDMAKVPKGMILPKTQRMYQIMKITATKSNESLQFEVFLKVKQQDHVDFQFLKADHELYPFYQWLKDLLSMKCKSRSETRSGNDEMNTIVEMDDNELKKEHAMGLLDMYATSSDDDSETAQVKSNVKRGCNDDNDYPKNDQHNAKKTCLDATVTQGLCKNSSNQSEIHKTEQLQTMDEKRQKRLKRAKMLREHFSNR